jgi:hypothetical protein
VSLNNFFYKIVFLFAEIGTIFNVVNLRVTCILRCKIPAMITSSKCTRGEAHRTMTFPECKLACGFHFIGGLLLRVVLHHA